MRGFGHWFDHKFAACRARRPTLPSTTLRVEVRASATDPNLWCWALRDGEGRLVRASACDYAAAEGARVAAAFQAAALDRGILPHAGPT